MVSKKKKGTAKKRVKKVKDPMQNFVTVKQGDGYVEGVQIGSLGVLVCVSGAPTFIKDASIQIGPDGKFSIVG